MEALHSTDYLFFDPSPLEKYSNDCCCLSPAEKNQREAGERSVSLWTRSWTYKEPICKLCPSFFSYPPIAVYMFTLKFSRANFPFCIIFRIQKL